MQEWWGKREDGLVLKVHMGKKMIAMQNYGGGDDEGVVALAISLVEGAAVVMPPAATAAAREELGGEANGADWFVTGEVGVAP